MPPKRIPKARSYPRSRHDSSSEEEDEELNELFRQAEIYSSNDTSNSIKKESNNKQNIDNNCNHNETIKENNLILCVNCG